MFKNLFKRTQTTITSKIIDDRPEEEKFFANVIGYSDIKRMLMRAVVTKTPSHALLVAPPASAKTEFLKAMAKGLDNAYFVDGTASTGPGMINYLFNNNIKYLLIDEIDKMNKRNQEALLNLMENGVISETKVKNTRTKKMKVWVFATSNDYNKVSNPIKSRFMADTYFLPEYNYEEFEEISRALCHKKYGHDEDLADYIAHKVWNRLKSKDIRVVLSVAKKARDRTDVDFHIQVKEKYSLANQGLSEFEREEEE